MEKVLLIFLVALSFLSSCGNDDDSDPKPTDYKSIDIVTGLDLLDANGAPIGRWEDPNDKSGEVSAFPNPSNGVITVFSLEEIVHIWLVPATCALDSNVFDIHSHSQSLIYQVSEIEAVQIRDIPFQDFNELVSLDFSDVSAGFYKIFYQMEAGNILWKNMYIDPAFSGIASFEALDAACN